MCKTHTHVTESEVILEMCWYLNAMGYLRFGRKHSQNKRNFEPTLNEKTNKKRTPLKRHILIEEKKCVHEFLLNIRNVRVLTKRTRVRERE